jgi:hypothetical protein
MKYTTKAAQPQMVGGVVINPKGGEINQKQLEGIKKDPWGKELISKGILEIEGVKESDIKAGDQTKKPEVPKSPGITTELNRVPSEEK